MSTFIIAEIGVNHGGDLNVAKRLIDLAAESGADAVKFQTFEASELVTKSAAKAAYQESVLATTQLEMLTELALDLEEFTSLFHYCETKALEFMSTAFDVKSLDHLVDLGIKRIKIPSGEITNLPFLEHIGKQDLPTLLSTGMSSLGEVETAISILENAGLSRDKVTVLHCSTNYPAPLDEANIRAISTLRAAFNVQVGYSDHTLGKEASLAAVSLGAKVIEKHFTFDKEHQGPDHRASMEPEEFSEFVSSIRKVELALGDGIKRPSPSEMQNIPAARRSLVTSKPVRKGELLSSANLAAKRPGTGVSPMRWHEVIGRVAHRDYEQDELLDW